MREASIVEFLLESGQSAVAGHLPGPGCGGVTSGMSDETEPRYLEPASGARLTEFARACRSAARAVSLYPPAHPAIGAALGRLVETARRATAEGALHLQVRSDAILVDGAVVQRPDPVIADLASLLHRHLIGGLVLQSGADEGSWRALLQLLAREPERTRADGGIAHLWATAGGPSLEILEIDYADVLRERATGQALLDEVVDACVRGQPLAQWSTEARDALVLPLEAERGTDLLSRFQARLAGQSAETKAAAFINLLKRVAEQVTERQPQQFDAVFRQIARQSVELGADTLAGVLRERRSPTAVAAGVNVVEALIERIDDEAIADLVSRTVIAERSPTARLAEAFQALVPEIDRQRQILALAGEKVARSPLADEDSFAGLWSRVENMMTSYTDAKWVSDDYARELSAVRSAAIDIDRVSDDPPERIAAWLATVNDSALRGLDLQLLMDLLRVEATPARWRDVVETVVEHIDDLARVELHDQAHQLADVVVEEATRPGDSPRKRFAIQALERIGQGPLVQQVAGRLRVADDEAVKRIARLCHAIGPSIIPALAEILSVEQHARTRTRLREILAGFGPSGRAAIQQLLDAPNWEVRRTAAFLLHELGGTESLASLEPLLRDAEPLVQREAIQAVVLDGSDGAFEMLLHVLSSSTSRVRSTLVHELSTYRDERAAPLFCYLVKHLDRRALRTAYQVALDSLGAFGGPDAVEALEFALFQGEWWAPLRSAALKARAAAALRRIGSAGAVDALRRASGHGPRSTRRAASVALAQLTGE